jgi:UDP-glucose 4-epimerase/long-chain acyl-CoA synthetase
MKKIFLTGSTGTIGLELVKELVRRNTEVHLLIRAKSPFHLTSRVEKVISFNGLEKYRKYIFSYSGDITKDQLGLSNKVYLELTNKITHITHCAGKVKLNQSKTEALELSKKSTEKIISFAKKCISNGQLERIDVTTTVGVGGKSTTVLPEAFLENRPIFHNNYEYGKYETEIYLQQLINDGLPITIHRPSMVVGHSKTGRASSFQVFYHLCDYFSGLKTMGVTTDLSTRSLDIIPVDIAAKLMGDIILSTKFIGEVVHISSGVDNELRLEDLKLQLRRIYSNHGHQIPHEINIPSIVLKKILEKRIKIDPLLLFLPRSLLNRREVTFLLKTLNSFKYLLEYLFTEQHFPNKKTLKELGKENSIPKPESYIENIINYYLENRESVSSEKTVSSVSKEVKKIETFRDYIWPHFRKRVMKTLTPRCTKCMISENISPLKDGVCLLCEHYKEEPKEAAPKDLEAKMSNEITTIIESNKSNYDAVVLFSGGKDSTYLIDRLLRDFPGIKLLALSFDNSFMAPVAKENINWVIKKLNLELHTIRPPQEMMIRMYRYAFTHLKATGCSGTVDQFDGDIIHDAARIYAKKNNIPMVFSGVSQTQVENIFEINSYKMPLSVEKKTRVAVGGIPLSEIFTKTERDKYWWSGAKYSPEKIPSFFFPFYAWKPNEEDVKQTVVRKKLIPPGNQSPLMTNSQLIVLMGVVDFAKLGYSSFEQEFAKNVRSGISDYEYWRNTFEIVEYMSKTGNLLDKSFYETLIKLGLKKSDIGLGHL